MAYDTPDLSGSLFKNDKEGNDKRPDYTGKIMIEGKEWRLAAWIKESQAGKKYMSLKASDPNGGQSQSPPAPRPERQPPPAKPAKPAGNGGGNRAPILDDDIPFAAEVR